jgi:hypothetical protein
VITVCLQTCDRPELTQRTLESFAAFNDLSRFDLLHADDASADGRNAALARQYGFKTVCQTSERLGVLCVRTALVRAALNHSANWVLHLENDIESVRPFPWDLFAYVKELPFIYCLRLYGRYKDRDKKEKCLETHKRRGHVPVRWRPIRRAPESAQVGEIHWSPQPAVTRIQELWSLHRTGQEPESQTVRVKHNVMVHIGMERRTPGRVL